MHTVSIMQILACVYGMSSILRMPRAFADHTSSSDYCQGHFGQRVQGALELKTARASSGMLRSGSGCRWGGIAYLCRAGDGCLPSGMHICAINT